MDNFDPYNVLLAIATNIPVLLMTAFVLLGHICNMFFTHICIFIKLYIYVLCLFYFIVFFILHVLWKHYGFCIQNDMTLCLRTEIRISCAGCSLFGWMLGCCAAVVESGKRTGSCVLRAAAHLGSAELLFAGAMENIRSQTDVCNLWPCCVWFLREPRNNLPPSSHPPHPLHTFNPARLLLAFLDSADNISLPHASILQYC